VVKKEKDIKCLLTRERKDLEKTDTRKRNRLFFNLVYRDL